MTVKRDIYVQYESFFRGIDITIRHFQLRRGMQVLDPCNLIYFTSLGLEKLNVVSGKRSTVLINYQSEEDYSKPICFDSKQLSDGSTVVVFGNQKGEIELYKTGIEGTAHLPLHDQKSIKVIKQISNVEVNLINDLKLISPNANTLSKLANTSSITHLMVSSNDKHVYLLDIENDFKAVKDFQCSDCVNFCDISFEKDLLCAVGDFEHVQLFDYKTCQEVAALKGHYDFGFTCKFKPSSDVVLSGNQDSMLKFWDVRSFSCFDTVCGHYDAIGDVIFNDSRRNLVYFFENMDTLYIYDMNCRALQQCSFFGRVSGISLLNKKLFCAINEYSYNGILVYDEIKPLNSLNCLDL